MRFPWSGGRHPCLDLLVETSDTLIGVESKRYEPYRPKTPTALSEAYWRPVWGDSMKGYEGIRDSLRDGSLSFRHLDAAQLVKHAFGLRTAGHRAPEYTDKRPVLLSLFAEPDTWPSGRAVSRTQINAHRDEVRHFADRVAGDEVAFVWCSYSDVLKAWSRSGDERLISHAAAIVERFRLPVDYNSILAQEDG
ncbi:hypothetical protein BB934_03990 [Microvirga ossetica]|uniref:Uncharacterized protein n=1 Tax=Microvirga ossetica TaxID=1882682 RepID=A0A1B2EC26_9HYPH|nr:hypothetical protein BB934_03990 [Microvirga ossetica]